MKETIKDVISKINKAMSLISDSSNILRENENYKINKKDEQHEELINSIFYLKREYKDLMKDIDYGDGINFENIPDDTMLVEFKHKLPYCFKTKKNFIKEIRNNKNYLIENETWLFIANISNFKNGEPCYTEGVRIKTDTIK